MITPHQNNRYKQNRTYTSLVIKGFEELFDDQSQYKVEIEAKYSSGFLMFKTDHFYKSSTFLLHVEIYDRDIVLKNLTPSGSLVIDMTLTLKILQETETCSVFSNPSRFVRKIVSKQIEMLENPQFSDFTFIVKGQKFEVHRSILANASPVFATLFTAKMKESRTGQCIVNDIEPEIFVLLLRFIYGGKIPENLNEVAMELYKAAKYYKIDELKEICGSKLFVS